MDIEKVKDRLLTVEDAAKLLHVGRSTMWRLFKEEGLPSIKVAKRRLVPVEALDEWIAARVKKGESDGV